MADLTEADLVALGTVPAPVAGVARTAGTGTGNNTMDALKLAQGAAGHVLDAKAQKAIDVASATSNQLMQQADDTIAALTAANVSKANVFQQQQDALMREGQAAGVIAAGTQDVAAGNLAILNDTFKPYAEVSAEIAREQAASLNVAESILDAQRELRNKPGIAGFFSRLITGNDLAEKYNEIAIEYNSRASMQASLLASTDKVAAHRIALVDQQTPEMKAAALELVQTANAKLLTEAKLKQADSEEQYFNQLLSASGTAAGAAAGEASRRITLSYQKFNTLIQAADLAQAQDALGGKLETDKRVEVAFNLSNGEGPKFMDRLQRADPEAAAAVLQASYSGRAQNSTALARAYTYMPPNQTTASALLTANAVMSAENKFPAFLLTKAGGGMDTATFSKLPAEQQMAIRKQFYATDGEIPSAMGESTGAALMRMLATTVPTGVISIPAVIGADGKTVTREAKTLPLRPMGELGKQLAVLDGDLTAAHALAVAAVVKDGRKPEDVAKELSNFGQNVLTVEAAFRGDERRQFGLSPATKLKATIKRPGYLYGVSDKNVDVASYPELLVELTRAKSAAFTQAVNEKVAPLGVTNEMVNSIRAGGNK